MLSKHSEANRFRYLIVKVYRFRHNEAILVTTATNVGTKLVNTCFAT